MIKKMDATVCMNDAASIKKMAICIHVVKFKQRRRRIRAAGGAFQTI
jgi:hypothetical protein